MTIETNEALLDKVKIAKVLLSKDAFNAKALLSKATGEAKSLLNEAAKTAEVKKSSLNEAAKTAEVLLSKGAADAVALLSKAAADAVTLLSKAAMTADMLLARVKRLEGIIPICSYCKKIRDDKDSWLQLEQYLSEHSDAVFSHGICPHCMEEQMLKL